jgi:hypothetical protein
MLACIALTIFINYPPPMADGKAHHEWQWHQFCEAGRELRDVPASSMEPSACAVAANQYLFALQMAGELPGARNIIQYKAVCTTTI